MKDLQKLAIILRALGMSTKVVSEPITVGDGTEIDNTFASIDFGKFHWDVWHDGKLFEVHFFVDHECIYDTVYYSFLLNTVSCILEDIQEHGK